MAWGIVAMIAIQVAMRFVQWRMDQWGDKDDAEAEDRFNRGSTTVAEEGSHVGMVLGTARVFKTNILMFRSKDTFKDYLTHLREGYADSDQDDRKDISVQVVLGVTARSINTAHRNEFLRLWIGESLVSDKARELRPTDPTVWADEHYRMPITTGYDITYQPLWGGTNFGGGVGHQAGGGAPGNLNYVSPDHSGGRIWTMPGDAIERENEQITELAYYMRWIDGDPSTGSWDIDNSNHSGAIPGVMKMYLSSFKIGEAASMPGFSVEVRCKPQYNGLSPISIESSVASIADATENVLESNPAACLYHILTDDLVGIGMDPAKIDVQSFNDSADTLYTEGNGFSMHIEKSAKCSKIIQEILKQIDGVLYTDSEDQRLTLGLVREDYTVPALQLFDDSNTLKVSSYRETSWEDTYNEVRVTYQDRRDEYAEKFAVAQDSANALKNGRIKSITVDFPGVKVASTANRLAARELQFHATPQTHVTLHLNRQGSTLSPGDVFRWSNDAYEITDMVLRIHKISPSEEDDGVVVAECTRDKYSDIASIFGDPDQNWYDDLTSRIKPVAPGCMNVLEVPPAPPFSGGSNWESPMFGAVMVAASPLPSGGGGTSSGGGYLDGNHSLINVNDGNDLATTGESTPCGTVGVAYSTSPGTYYYYDTQFAGLSVSFDAPVGFIQNWTDEEVRAGRAILSIGDEYMSYEGFTDTEAPTYRSSTQTETAASQTNISITLPAGVVDGDLLIAMINLGTAGLSTAPAGWAHVQGSPHLNTGSATENNFVVMTKVASSETGPYLWVRDAADLMEIQGSIHAFYNATLETAAVSPFYDTVTTGVNSNVYSSVNISSDLVVTGIAISDSWWSGTSLILPSDGFTEIDDSSSAIDGHLQVQYGPVPSIDGNSAPDSIAVDLNLAGVTPTSAFTTVVLGLKGPATRSYKLTNVWRGLFDTVPVDHAVGTPVFFISEANIGRTINKKDFSCVSDAVISYETSIGVRSQYTVPKVDAGIVLTRRSERPARPTAFVLRDDGPDAGASGPEFDYAYDADDTRAIVNASVIGADTKISTAGVYGDVWTNDLRATWNRRPRLSSCENSVVRGDDPDVAYGTEENTRLCVEAKGDRETSWSTIAQEAVRGDAIRSSTEFVSMSQVEAGVGSLRLCALGESPLTGEVLASREAESVTVDVHTSRQLLLNPNFRPYWDVDSDSSVASGKGQVLPGNPVYSARGWRNVTAGSGRPRYKVMDGSILQGVNTEGFAFTGEFIANEFVTVEQVVAVPYLDTEGSVIYLSWWFQVELGDDTEWYDVTIDTLDVNGVVLDNINETANVGHVVVDKWSKYDLTLSSISAAVRSIRVVIGGRNTTTGGPAFCKISMVMGRDIAENQLVNPNFNTPLSDWSDVGTPFTSETAPTYGGGVDPVNIDFARFAQAGATDGELYQDVAIPAAFGTGDYVRLQWWTANTATPGYGYIILSTRDAVSAQVESITVGGGAHPILDQWYYHEAYLKITGECVDVRASINYKDGSGAGADFLCDAMDMTFIKAGHS